MAMWKWQRDQKSKPEVNSRDVINLTSEAYVRRSHAVTITDIWTKFGTQHKYHTVKTRVWRNSHNLKIQDGGDRHFEFRINVSNSGLDKDVCTKLYGKMHHGHAEMTTWSKVETWS